LKREIDAVVTAVLYRMTAMTLKAGFVTGRNIEAANGPENCIYKEDTMLWVYLWMSL